MRFPITLDPVYVRHVSSTLAFSLSSHPLIHKFCLYLSLSRFIINNKGLSSMTQNSVWNMTGMSTLLGRDTTAGLLVCKRRRRRRNPLDWDKYLREMRHNHFRSMFRMSNACFLSISDTIGTFMDRDQMTILLRPKPNPSSSKSCAVSPGYVTHLCVTQAADCSTADPR